MRKIILLLFIITYLGECSFAQSKTHFGITLGFQPALRNQIEQTETEQVSDFPIYFLKHFNAGIFLRQSCTKHIYLQLDITASLDADWRYVSYGNGLGDELGRAFDKPSKIHLDIPIYIGAYIVKSNNFALRIFGCPQLSMRANTAYNFSPIIWNSFVINTGLGIDLLSFITFNVNYKVPFIHGEAFFEQSKLCATIGLMF